jgi:DNA invertase Pin-like site-specific DNA recombinase
MTTRTECVFYARASTKKQEDSVPIQREWAERAAAQHGLAVVQSFADEGIPGDEIAFRPGLQQLLAYVEERAGRGSPVPVLLVYDADRISRASSIRTGAILTRLLDAGTSRMVTNDGVIDLTEDTDLLIYNLKQDTAKAAYSKLLSGRVANAMFRKVKSGQWPGGPCPYGYRVGADGHLRVEPAEGEVVRWLFESYADRATTVVRLAEELNAKGVPAPVTCRTGYWSRWLVWNLLRNQNYQGHLFYGRRPSWKYSRVLVKGVERTRGVKTNRGKQKKELNPVADWLVIEDAHPALVSPALFAEVKAKLAAACPDKHTSTRRRVRADWPLAGLCHCGDCGKRMTGMTMPIGRKKARFVRSMACQTYRNRGRSACSRNDVAEAEILETVFDVVREQFSDPATFRTFLDDVRADRERREGDSAAERATLRARVADLTAKVRNGAERIAGMKLKPEVLEEVARTITDWKAERAKAEARLKDLADEATAAGQQENETAAALAAFERLGELVRDAHDLPEVRDALHLLVDKIELHFEQKDTAARRISTCTGLTVHWRPLAAADPCSRSSDVAHRV